MSFLHPAAFFGLASILILILLSLWRQRPARVTVPSVRLWERISDRLPPVRALKRPRASFSLLLQILVAGALVLALAGPGCESMKPAPRRIAVVIDLSASMAPRLEAVRRELAKLDPADHLVWIESPTLARRTGLGDLSTIDRWGDPGPALDLAASEAKVVVFISDRAPAWTPPPDTMLHLALVGGPLKNVGIVDAGVDRGMIFARLTETAELTVGDRRYPAATFHLIPVPGDGSKIELSLAPDDFPADDRVVLERTGGRIDVGFSGRPDASILAAIESNPHARVIRGGSPRLLIRIGEPAGPSTAPVVVDVDPLEGVESRGTPGEISVASHELTREVVAEDLKFTEVGRLSGPLEAPLFFSGGAPVAAVRRPGEIVLSVKYASSGWPARPSFPIFWANVLKYAASGAESWTAKGLLDERASRPGLERRPVDPAALGPRVQAPRRTDLSGAAVALAAALLSVLWFAERRQTGAG